MKFDFAIGNPPYQDETLGDNKGFAPPVYNKFLDAAYGVADKVEMIHPARFLFNAGSTPKDWNEKMLNDPHFKVLDYESDCTKVFQNTEIKGGVAITYRDGSKEYGEIGVFTEYIEMNSILQKVLNAENTGFLDSIAVSGYSYHFTELMHQEHPEIKQTVIVVGGKEKPLLSKGHEYDLKSNVIEKLPNIFLSEKEGNYDYIKIIGRENNERVTRFIRRDYINNVINLDTYKLFLPKASGIGEFGEQLAPAIVVEPGVGHTETFFSIGSFEEKEEAENLHKYLKCKFSRALLCVLKKTQMITPGILKYVPLQDFKGTSDIVWTNTLHEIDQQLYKKYDLSQEEIDFIETNVKEMV